LTLEKELSAARKRQEGLQNPKSKSRADEATAKSAAAMEKARAAAKKKPSGTSPQ
jgi:hypothetical protein